MMMDTVTARSLLSDAQLDLPDHLERQVSEENRVILVKREDPELLESLCWPSTTFQEAASNAHQDHPDPQEVPAHLETRDCQALLESTESAETTVASDPQAEEETREPPVFQDTMEPQVSQEETGTREAQDRSDNLVNLDGLENQDRQARMEIPDSTVSQEILDPKDLQEPRDRTLRQDPPESREPMEAQANQLPTVPAHLSLEEDVHHPHRDHPTTTQLRADPLRLAITHSRQQEPEEEEEEARSQPEVATAPTPSRTTHPLDDQPHRCHPTTRSRPTHISEEESTRSKLFLAAIFLIFMSMKRNKEFTY